MDPPEDPNIPATLAEQEIDPMAGDCRDKARAYDTLRDAARLLIAHDGPQGGTKEWSEAWNKLKALAE